MVIKGGKILTADFVLEIKDIYINNGKITFDGDDTDIINADGLMVIPEFVDINVCGDDITASLNSKAKINLDKTKSSIYEGQNANLVVIDSSFDIKYIIKNGEVAYRKDDYASCGIASTSEDCELNTSDYEVSDEFADSTENNTLVSIDGVSKLQLKKFTELRNEILKSVAKEWTLEEMATKVGYSISRFCHLYKKVFNITPMLDLSNIKVESSKHYLVNTDLTVAQIAVVCGFSSDSNYLYVFKKATGKTPSEYRAKSIDN